MKLRLPILLIIVSSLGAHAQRAASVRVVRQSPDQLYGTAIAEVDGTDRVVSSHAFDAWVIGNGRAVVYSSSDGAGGFENEGQSLWRYDVSSGNRRKLLTEYFMIRKVVEARSDSGRTALLVTMMDGGLGAPHVAVADPIRGEVWRHRIARFVGVRNGNIAVGLYRPEEIGKADPMPYRIIYRDLDNLLRMNASPYRPVGTSGQIAVTGQVNYREQETLPRGSVMTLRLVDVSRPESPTLVASRQVSVGGSRFPISFTLPYDPSLISSERRYELQVGITGGGMRFVNVSPVQVITLSSAARDIAIDVKREE